LSRMGETYTLPNATVFVDTTASPSYPGSGRPGGRRAIGRAE
jgi:hypothetical protein